MPLYLHNHSLHLWIARVNELVTPELIAFYRQWLPTEELKKCERLSVTADRQRALISRILVRTVISLYENGLPWHWQLILAPTGKPQLANRGSSLKFNLSHSGNLVVCALCYGSEIGVDTEVRKNDRDVLSLASRFFSRGEFRELSLLPAPLKSERFYDLWTLRESLLKAIGIGIGGNSKNFGFKRISEGEYQMLTSGSFSPGVPEWRHQIISVDDQPVAITHKVTKGALELFELSPELVLNRWRQTAYISTSALSGTLF